MIKSLLGKLVRANPRLALAELRVRHHLSMIWNRVGMRHAHQESGTTQYDRHPLVFNAAREIVGNHPPQKILSYGCSTGEEVFTLAQYFPDAQVFGADINRKRLKVAEAANVDKKATFFFSSEKNLKLRGPFDLIFAKSVFIRHPEDTLTDNLRSIYPFDIFEQGIAMLLENLTIGGLLVIYNANYRVMDTQLRDRVEVVRHRDVCQAAEIPLFEPDGRKCPAGRYEEQFFRRVC